MFYDIFSSLCKRRGIRPSKAAEECGINKSNVSNWKNNGYVPRGEALGKLATYFGVSVDYLLGNEQKEKASSLDGKKPEDITFDDFSYAMHNESGNLSAEDKEILLNLARDLAKHRMEKDRRKEK